ncbi:MAG: hypothetical protein AAF600_09105 [Bacteroidota bacterium]
MVKNSKLKDGKTFHERLESYFESKETLNSIVTELPLLTIMIPTLPNFNPESWNPTSEVPLVAVLHDQDNEIPFFDSNGELIESPRNAIPGFPTILLKTNERVLVNKVNETGGRVNETSFYNNDLFSFKYLDKIFDGTNV